MRIGFIFLGTFFSLSNKYESFYLTYDILNNIKPTLLFDYDYLLDPQDVNFLEEDLLEETDDLARLSYIIFIPFFLIIFFFSVAGFPDYDGSYATYFQSGDFLIYDLPVINQLWHLIFEPLFFIFLELFIFYFLLSLSSNYSLFEDTEFDNWNKGENHYFSFNSNTDNFSDFLTIAESDDELNEIVSFADEEDTPEGMISSHLFFSFMWQIFEGSSGGEHSTTLALAPSSFFFFDIFDDILWPGIYGKKAYFGSSKLGIFSDLKRRKLGYLRTPIRYKDTIDFQTLFYEEKSGLGHLFEDVIDETYDFTILNTLNLKIYKLGLARISSSAGFFLFSSFYPTIVNFLNFDTDTEVEDIEEDDERSDFEELDPKDDDRPWDQSKPDEVSDWLETFLNNIDLQVDDYLTHSYIVEGDDETELDDYIDIDEDNDFSLLESEIYDTTDVDPPVDDTFDNIYEMIDYVFDEEDDDNLGDADDLESSFPDYPDELYDDEDLINDFFIFDTRFFDELYNMFDTEEEEPETSVLPKIVSLGEIDFGYIAEDDSSDINFSFSNDNLMNLLFFLPSKNSNITNQSHLIKRISSNISYYFNFLKYFLKFILKMK